MSFATDNTAFVMEILKVYWYLGTNDFADQASVHFGYLTTATARADAEATSVDSLVEDFRDPLTIAPAATFSRLATQGGTALTLPIEIDTTDGNGNGILVATNQIFIIGGNLNGLVAAEYVAKILYRLVEVGIQEYVGIVQSQQ